MSSVTICHQCQKPLTEIQQSRRQKFCSKNCKSNSQKKSISVICRNCSKKFSLLPYLKRTTNYCSRRCYWNFTREKRRRFCAICHKEFMIKAYLVKQGFGIFCSRECQHKSYPNKIEKFCLRCKKLIHVQPSKKDRVYFCSKKCKDDYERDYVQRTCKNCHQSFQLPRWELNKGKGSFCSWRCFIQYKGETAIEKKVRYALQKTQIEFHQEFKIGIYHADFLLPQHKIVLECDGDYWHSIPAATKRDQRKDDYLQNQGYRIVRLAEETIRKLTRDKLTSMLYQIIEPSAASETTGRDPWG